MIRKTDIIAIIANTSPLIVKTAFDLKVTGMKTELPDIANIVRKNDFDTEIETIPKINRNWNQIRIVEI